MQSWHPTPDLPEAGAQDKSCARLCSPQAGQMHKNIHCFIIYNRKEQSGEWARELKHIRCDTDLRLQDLWVIYFQVKRKKQKTLSSLPKTFLVAQVVKKLPAMQETWVRSLGRGDPMEKVMATHSRILTWKIPMDRGAWQATVNAVAKSWTWLSN